MLRSRLWKLIASRQFPRISGSVISSCGSGWSLKLKVVWSDLLTKRLLWIPKIPWSNKTTFAIFWPVPKQQYSSRPVQVIWTNILMIIYQYWDDIRVTPVAFAGFPFLLSCMTVSRWVPCRESSEDSFIRWLHRETFLRRHVGLYRVSLLTIISSSYCK